MSKFIRFIRTVLKFKIMNNIDESKMDCYKETDKVLDKYAVIYETDVSTKDQKLIFTGYKIALIGFAQKMDKPTAWLTEDKCVVKNAILAKLHPFSNSLVCFANSKSDNLMLEKVKLSKSELQHLSESNLLVYSQQAIEIARANLTELPPFAITEDSIVALETDRTAFAQRRTDRIMLLEDKAVARREFNRIKKETNRFLKDELDHSIEKYRKSHPEFVNHYFKARKMPKIVRRSYDVLGYITDAVSGEPVSYGTVWVEGLDMSTAISENGSFRFKSFPAGEYRLKIENMAYKTFYVTIRRYAPEHCRLNLTMELLGVEQTQPV